MIRALAHRLAAIALAVLALAALAAGATTVAAQSSTHFHHLPATPHTVAYGYYSAAAKPVLRVASGDTVEVETLLTNTPRGLTRAGLPASEVQQSLINVVDSVKDRGPGGHILTGPIYVAGADSGDVLEVRILNIHFAIPYAYNGCSGFLRQNCGQPRTRIIQLDTTRMVASLGDGIVIPLHPFFGSMGDAPPRDSGRVSSNPPSIHGGNMDNKELVAGTTLYLPVWTPGALLEIGDGHAAQGDGEVDQTAIETSLVGDVQLIVRKDMHLTWPMAETPTDYITMGMDRDLTKATQICVQQMIDFLMRKKGLPRVEAYRLASVAANLHITELVDGNVGVHMMIPKSVLGEGKR
ncbi:MAG TPA: acetamidase/formamidase family protein [Gemmatimonadaceae bacterium]|nr:acetamidase/formamidase family protein [Gemmatimonadaceae bacterium]